MNQALILNAISYILCEGLASIVTFIMKYKIYQA